MKQELIGLKITDIKKSYDVLYIYLEGNKMIEVYMNDDEEITGEVIQMKKERLGILKGEL
jgi:hypothetical protein